MPADLASPSTITHTFVIPKRTGLGLIIGGGVGRFEGPYIMVEKMLNGMDAAKVCCSKK